MINSVRNTVLAILNKHNYGSIPVADFNEYCKTAQMELFMDIFERYNKIINEENKRVSGTERADREKALAETIDYFTETEILTNTADNKFAPPTNIYRINDIFVYDVSVSPKVFLNTAEHTLKSVVKKLNLSNLSIVSTTFPLYSYQDGVIELWPESITGAGSVEVEYVRFPLDPKWTFVSLSGGDPLFNGSANDYQDFELPQDFYVDIIMKILEYTGLSIRESEVYKYVKAGEQIELVKRSN